MARFENGWVKVHRRLIESDIGNDGLCLAVFITLLCWATRQETTIRWRGKPRKIPVGSAVFGLRELAEQLQINKTTVRKKLEYLQNRDTLVLETEPRGTLVTIRNYTQYQCNITEGGQTLDKVETQSGRRVDGEWDTIGEVKNIRREEEKSVSFQNLKKTWLETLKHFGIERGITLSEEDTLYRVYKGGKAKPEHIDLALYGCRFEAGTEGFNPAQNVSLDRVLLPKAHNGKSLFEKFLNLGIQNRAARDPNYDPNADKMKADRERDQKIHAEILAKQGAQHAS